MVFQACKSVKQLNPISENTYSTINILKNTVKKVELKEQMMWKEKIGFEREIPKP